MKVSALDRLAMIGKRAVYNFHVNQKYTEGWENVCTCVCVCVVHMCVCVCACMYVFECVCCCIYICALCMCMSIVHKRACVHAVCTCMCVYGHVMIVLKFLFFVCVSFASVFVECMIVHGVVVEISWYALLHLYIYFASFCTCIEPLPLAEDYAL